ncbi:MULTISPECIES: hypothetical protein [unclassified Streptomyces]|uniref:hypothetical protein n=1 Tax=unclassified Streptomyces TaxID=2593676 RepID=UPI002E331F88|nr:MULTISPECIES: hypothetical protein [unclassified Streptomyces]WUC68193.1 hypothetical protein OG861_30305 [Streptomyces sp. NBC_00539]
MDDFDFLHGCWDVANRRLTAPLGSGPATWVEFPGHAVVRSLFGGAGNIDELSLPTLARQGVTLRLFDRELERWSIHWSDSRTGRLDPPVVGGFTGDRGDFHGEDTYDGRPIRVHFTWYRLGPDAARWEQEFSGDDGLTWELNWIMDFTRTAAAGA